MLASLEALRCLAAGRLARGARAAAASSRCTASRAAALMRTFNVHKLLYVLYRTTPRSLNTASKLLFPGSSDVPLPTEITCLSESEFLLGRVCSIVLFYVAFSFVKV